MILLEHVNIIVHDLILADLSAEKPTTDSTCSDFDGCQLHIWWTSATVVNVSLKSGAAKSLLENGGHEILTAVYGSSFAGSPEAGYDAQITGDVSALPPGEREAFATKFAQFKNHLYSAPIMRCVRAASEGRVQPGISDVAIRSSNERLWVKQDDTDRVTIIFSVDFSDPDDVVFGRVFLNEIKKPVQGAPTVDYTTRNTPPMELRAIRGLPVGDSVSYVTFVLFKRHWTPITKAQASLFTLISFRNYLHYHINVVNPICTLECDYKLKIC